MKIGCYCGETIYDSTDNLPHKARVIPDQEWLAVWDALDDHVIDPVANGHSSKEDACMRARRIIGRPARQMWQCHACGRLYIDDLEGQLQCYVPADEQTNRQILRGAKRAGNRGSADGTQA